MPFHEQLTDGELSMSWSGDIDANTAYQPYESAVEAFENHAIDRVLIDLTGLTFADSTALGTLVRINELASQHDATMAIRHVPPRVRSLLSMTGLDQSLPVVDE